MACDTSNKIQGGKIVILPSGCLGTTEIDLQCKSPTESMFYQFSMTNRMTSTDRIMCVVASPSSSDDTIVVDQITVSGQTFKVRISGGLLNTKVGIKFTVTTALTEVLTFVATLPISPSGIIGEGPNGSYVIGNDGPQGEQGKAATVTVGQVSASASGSDPQVKNSGTQYDAVLDFTLPRGEQGIQGLQGEQGVQGIQGLQGLQGLQGEKGTQILTSNRDPVNDDSGKNLVWLNTATGDLFETIPNGDNYIWDKIGNLKGEAGNLIYSGTSDPIYNDLYKSGDLYLNTASYDLFSFNKIQWVRLNNLKGNAGERGSLWFFGQEDPVTSTHFKELDGFLNTKTYDFFVFNGNNWQKSGNLKGTTGETGVQGIKGDQGIEGPQGPEGKRGSLWITAEGAPASSTNYKEWDLYFNSLNSDVYVNNGSTWQLIANIKGATGDTGLQGPKGDDGVNPKLSIGSVTTLESTQQASAEIVYGVNGQDTLNLAIPRGQDGNTSINFLKGKKVSIYGDSVSTYAGYIPNANIPYVYPSGDVTSVNQIWWKQYIDKTGAVLGINDSWGGSNIYGDATTDTSCLLYRITQKSMPTDTDLCLVFMGVNDFRNGIGLGNFNPYNKTPSTTTSFSDAVCSAMELMNANYPNTKFVWMTPLGDFTNGGVKELIKNRNGNTLWEFMDIIINAAKYYGHVCIDMRNYFCYSQYKETLDGLHPNSAGMTRLANSILHETTNILG